MTTRTVFVTKGGWRTLEVVFGASRSAAFVKPAGAQIKVRYGVGWFGFDRQKQKLDGITAKTLSVGATGSLARARMQMKVVQDTEVTYEFFAELDQPSLSITGAPGRP